MLKRRQDLVESTLVAQGENLLVVKDPVALKYFRLRDAEAELLKLLDGKNSLSQICRMLQVRFPSVSVHEREVHLAIQNFHKQGLLVSRAVKQGAVFEKRKREHDWKKVGQLFSSILAIRFPGINPQPFLDVTYPWVRWALHPVCVVICLVFMLSAISIIVGNLELLYRSLPGVSTFFAFGNLPFLALTIFVTKTVHELGHAYVCKHFGAQCHSIGFMLLVLSPAAYCDTSDSWMIPNRYKRMLIAAAGMFFELIVAACATFVWYYTEPGWLHFFCLNLMIVSSVTTVLFNANPLLRYDGYYILGDMLEIPNLAQRSRMALLSWLRQLALGLPKIQSEFLPRRHRVFFVGYAIASFVYRWFILAVIYWFIISFFESNQIAVVGYVITAISLGWTFGQPIRQCVKFFKNPGRRRQIKKGRFVTSILLLGVLAALVCFLPVRKQVLAPLIIEPKNYKTAFVETPGVLKKVNVTPGFPIKRGDVIAELSNLEFELELIELKSRIVEKESKVELYKAAQNQSSVSSLEFASSLTELQKLRRQLVERQSQLEKLMVRSPIDGVVIPIADRKNKAQSPDIFEACSVDAFLQTETPLCHVGASGRFTATAYFDQESVKKINVGQQAELLLDNYSETVVDGVVLFVADKKTDEVPPALTRLYGGDVGVAPNAEQVRPISSRYKVEIEFDSELAMRVGMRGQAKILVENSTLSRSAYRKILKLIRFR